MADKPNTTISDKTQIQLSLSVLITFLVSVIGTIGGGAAWLSFVWATLKPLPVEARHLRENLNTYANQQRELCYVLEGIQRAVVRQSDRRSIKCSEYVIRQ